MITFQDGGITGFISEAGGYIYRSNDSNSRSLFAKDGFFASTFGTAWQQFKFGGEPGSQQIAYFVNLKEIPDNKFGTQSEIYWNDAYLNAQVGALTRGTYTLKIVDPLLFVKNFVPASYITGQNAIFDFSDFDNPASEQLFNEFVASLAPSFSKYTNDPSRNRIAQLQSDTIGLTQSLSTEVETNYQWKSQRGLEIVRVALVSVEYDEDTRKLLSDVKKADALSGNRAQSFLQQSLARGLQGAGENGDAIGGVAGILGLGLGGNLAAGGMFGNNNTTSTHSTPESTDDDLEKFKKIKTAFDEGLITENDFNEAKKKFLNL